MSHVHVTCRLGIRRRRNVESDTVSLCDVTGERERGGGRQGGNESPSRQRRKDHPTSHSPVSDDAQELSSLLSVLPHPTLTTEGVDTDIRTSTPAERGGATGGRGEGRRRSSGWRGSRDELWDQKTKEVRPIMVWNER